MAAQTRNIIVASAIGITTIAGATTVTSTRDTVSKVRKDLTALEQRVSKLDGGATTIPTTSIPTTVPSTSSPPNACKVDPANSDEAITAAIRDCPDGSVVSFPAGKTYSADGPIRIDDRNNLTIDGNGSTFVTTSTATAPGRGNFVVLRGKNISFQKIIARGAFDLRPTNGKYSLNYPPGIGWEPNAGLAFFGTDGGGVRDSQIFNVWGDGVFMAFDGILDDTVQCSLGICNWQVARNLVIEKTLVDNAARTCWSPTNAKNVTIQDSVCKNAWMSGIDAEADGDPDGNVNNALPLDGIKILRNTFDGYNIAAIAVPVGGDAWQPNPADRTVVGNVEVRGNRILTTPTINPCFSPVLMGIFGYDPRNRIQNVVVEENTVTYFSVAVEFNLVDNGTIKNNKFVYNDLGLSGGPKVQCDPDRRQTVIVRDSTASIENNG